MVINHALIAAHKSHKLRRALCRNQRARPNCCWLHFSYIHTVCKGNVLCAFYMIDKIYKRDYAIYNIKSGVGKLFDVIFYSDKDGDKPVREFIKSLDVKL